MDQAAVLRADAEVPRKCPESKCAEGEPRPPPGWGARHTFSLLCFAAFFVCYALRFTMPIAIVAMVIKSE